MRLGLSLGLGNQALAGGGAETLPPVTGYTAWWDMSYAAGLFTDSALTAPAVVGDAIGGITDRSGTGNHLVQATGGLRPTLASVASKKSLRFGGAQNMDVPATLSFNRQNCTIFVVNRVHTLNKGTSHTLLNAPQGSTNMAVYLNAGTYANEMRYWRSATVATSIDTTMGIATAVAVWRAGDSKGFYGNESFAAAAGTASTSTGGYIGRWGTAINFLIGDIYEVLVYPTGLTDPQIATVKAYLDAKWGGMRDDVDTQFVYEGDSTTAGVDAAEVTGDNTPFFAARRDYSYPFMVHDGTVRWYNDGLGGDTASAMAAATNVINTLTNNATACPNKRVMFKMGTNDISAAVASATVIGYIDTFIANIRAAHPTAVIIGETILPRDPFSVFQDSEIAVVNAHLRTTADVDHLIDWDTVSGVNNAAIVADYSDGIHPTRLAKSVMASTVSAALAGWGLL